MTARNTVALFDAPMKISPTISCGGLTRPAGSPATRSGSTAARNSETPGGTTRPGPRSCRLGGLRCPVVQQRCPPYRRNRSSHDTRAASLCANRRWHVDCTSIRLRPFGEVRHESRYRRCGQGGLRVRLCRRDARSGPRGATDRMDPEGRLRLLDRNAEIYRDMVPRILAAAPTRS